MVELDIYAMGKPTGAKITVDPRSWPLSKRSPVIQELVRWCSRTEPTVPAWAIPRRSWQSSARSDGCRHASGLNTASSHFTSA